MTARVMNPMMLIPAMAPVEMCLGDPGAVEASLESEPELELEPEGGGSVAALPEPPVLRLVFECFEVPVRDEGLPVLPVLSE